MALLKAIGSLEALRDHFESSGKKSNGMSTESDDDMVVTDTTNNETNSDGEDLQSSL